MKVYNSKLLLKWKKRIMSRNWLLLGRLEMRTKSWVNKNCTVTLGYLLIVKWKSLRWNSPSQNTGGVPSPWYLPNLGIEPRSPALQVDSLPSDPPRKPKNTGVNSLSLLQENFPTQQSNWALLHCRQVLYQPSYQGTLVFKRLKKKRTIDG